MTLVPHYRQFSDAARGPLSLQRPDNAFGMIVFASGNRFRVRQGTGGGEGHSSDRVGVHGFGESVLHGCWGGGSVT